MNRIFPILLLLFFTLFNCTENRDIPEKEGPESLNLEPDWYNVAFLIMDGTYNTEFTAPFDIFQHTRFRQGIKAMNTFTIADTRDPITTFEGVKIVPDLNYLTDSLPRVDILVVPSAEHHLDSDLENEAMITLVKRLSENAKYVTSHCDGSFVLAKAGLLDDVVSTTFPGDLDRYQAMFPQLEVVRDVWFVHDDKYITSAGGARSFEAALYLCQLLYGKEIAQSLASGLVIDWDLNTVPHTIVSPGRSANLQNISQ